jgi:hypothetical protein
MAVPFAKRGEQAVSGLQAPGVVEMTGIVFPVLIDTGQITLLVLTMMVVVDLINVWTRGGVSALLQGGKHNRQYLVAPLLGVMPGCVGAFTNVSLYTHGMISFGALVGAMAAVSGDEAFVMLALFPGTAILLFGILFVIGVIVGWLSDRLINRWRIKTCEGCATQLIHAGRQSAAHYLKDHLWGHIIKRHLWKTVIWTCAALLVVKVGQSYWDLDRLGSEHTYLMLIAGALLGLVPESGPHLVFVSLYASGLIPFSVLLTSSIVQDGHGMLPMLAFSVKDSLLVKGFNLVFGLSIGFLLYALGT